MGNKTNCEKYVNAWKSLGNYKIAMKNNNKIPKYSRGADFGMVGKGKSGPMKKDRKGWEPKNDRKSTKKELKKLYN